MDFFDKEICELELYVVQEQHKRLSDEKKETNLDNLDKLGDAACTIVYTGKIVEAIIGIILLIPPILGALAFTLNLFDWGGKFAKMTFLSANWTCDFSGQGGGGMSAAPIFLGLMAIAGVLLIKDNIKYLFLPKK